MVHMHHYSILYTNMYIPDKYNKFETQCRSCDVTTSSQLPCSIVDKITATLFYSRQDHSYLVLQQTRSQLPCSIVDKITATSFYSRQDHSYFVLYSNMASTFALKTIEGSKQHRTPQHMRRRHLIDSVFCIFVLYAC